MNYRTVTGTIHETLTIGQGCHLVECEIEYRHYPAYPVPPECPPEPEEVHLQGFKALTLNDDERAGHEDWFCDLDRLVQLEITIWNDGLRERLQERAMRDARHARADMEPVGAER
jgi:hypothetical protein